jgi:hypothetical protein
MKRLAIATMFSAALALGTPALTTLHAQQATTTAAGATTTTDDHDADKAKKEAHKAGDDAKDAAKKTGAAAKHAGKATAHASKSAAKTVAKDSKETGKAIKGEVTGDHSKATAKCADGTFWYSAEHAGACSGHGGVANWMN